MGSINGLVCLCDHRSGVLWNPSIRKYFKLPPHSIRHEYGGPFSDAFGFGFDVKTNDYKVVRIVYPDYPLEGDLAELYSFNRGSWGRIKGPTYPHCWVDSWNPHCWVDSWNSHSAFTDGVVHWVGFSCCLQNEQCNLVLSFDMGSDVFREMMLPKGLVSGEHRLYILVCAESLSVLESTGTFVNPTFFIWVIMEYGAVESWTKLYIIQGDRLLRN